eukprot:2695420-Prymnesium_polylepis.1
MGPAGAHAQPGPHVRACTHTDRCLGAAAVSDAYRMRRELERARARARVACADVGHDRVGRCRAVEGRDARAGRALVAGARGGPRGGRARAQAAHKWHPLTAARERHPFTPPANATAALAPTAHANRDATGSRQPHPDPRSGVRCRW